MPGKTVTALLREQYQDMFSAEKKVADLILRDPNAILGMTVAELAKESGVSDATVVRMCHHAGFKGYYQFRVLLANDAADFKTALLGEHHVQQNEVRLERVCLCYGFFAVACRFDFIVFELEVILEPKPDDFFVFNNEDSVLLHNHSAFLNLTVKVEPLPGLLVSEMVALCVSATRLTMASPSPEPFVLRVISSPTL